MADRVNHKIVGGHMNRKENKVKILALISILLLLVGCASQQRTVTESEVTESTESAVASNESVGDMTDNQVVVNAVASQEPETAAPNVSVSQAVIEVVKQLRDHSGSLFNVGENSYQFFVGGVINAKYFPGDERLIVSDLATSEGFTCEYSVGDDLKINAVKELPQGCEGLIKKLSGLLAE